jgi:hypothetical protein
MLAGIDFGERSVETGPTGGSAAPVERPRDVSLSAAPPTDCGDVASSATNCGWCGHSCQGLACNAGRCEERVIVSASTISDFVTDGVDLFVIAEREARACQAAGPSDQLCTTIVSAQAVRARVGQAHDWESGGGGGKKITGGGQTMPLEPKALTLQSDRLLIADDAYHAVLSCPTKSPCDETNLGAIDTRGEDNSTAELFGHSLASGPSGLSWTQGGALYQATPPTTGQVIDKSILRRSNADTANTARILVPAGIFWLSTTGLHHASSIDAAPERWSSTLASDFSVDGEGVYLATQGGIVRVGTDRKEMQAADGEFQRVAASGGRVYATRPATGGIAIVEVRTGKLLELAIVPGPIASLAIAGDWLYYAVPIASHVEIRRVPR